MLVLVEVGETTFLDLTELASPLQTYNNLKPVFTVINIYSS